MRKLEKKEFHVTLLISINLIVFGLILSYCTTHNIFLSCVDFSDDDDDI